jgi:hypothetical protein
MDLLNFLLLVLAAVGMSHILADGSIFAPLKFWMSKQENWFTRSLFSRKLLELLNCYQCNGFWSGLITYSVYCMGWNWFLWALAISLVSPFFGYLKLYFNILTDVGEHDEK